MLNLFSKWIREKRHIHIYIYRQILSRGNKAKIKIKGLEFLRLLIETNMPAQTK